MNQRIVYTLPNGGVAVIVPAPDCGLTVEEIAAKDVPAGVQYQIVAAEELPADRIFRNAWRLDAGAVRDDLAASRLIAHEHRRRVRAQEFAPLDVEATIPARASQAEAARQVIRDRHALIQSRIDAAVDVAELRAEVSALVGG